MAICTFWGHKEIYDTGIDDMLQTAVEYITKFVLLRLSITRIEISGNDRHSPIVYALKKCGINEEILCIDADSQEELPYTELGLV